MASKKKIKGINLEIGGNTTGLNKALGQVNHEARLMQKELTEVNRALKFDSTNTVLLSQKQEILQNIIGKTSEKLTSLENAQEGVNKAFANNEIDESRYREFTREIEKTRQSLNHMGKQAEIVEEKIESTNEELNSFSNVLKTKVSKNLEDTDTVLGKVNATLKKTAAGFEKVKSTTAGGVVIGTIKSVGNATVSTGKAIGTATKTMAKGYASFVTATGVALIGLGGASYKAVTDLEATEAKYNTVFGEFTDTSDQFIKDFQKLTPASTAAARSMASGIQDILVPLGMAREEATDFTGETMHLVGALTNFNSATETAESVTDMFTAGLTSSYEGFERVGIIMDDNMVREKAVAMGLAKTTEEVSEQAKAQAMLQLATESSKDALSAYNEESLDVKTQMGLMKAEVTDMLAVVGADMLPVLNDTVAVLRDGMGEVLPDVTNLFSGFVGVLSGAEGGAEKFADGFEGVLNSMIGGVQTLIPNVLEVMEETQPVLIDSFFQLVDGVIETAPELVPKFIDMGFELITGLIGGMENSTPKLIDSGLEIIKQIPEMITENLPLIFEAGIGLIVELAKGIPEGTVAIIGAMPQVINSIIGAIFDVNWLEVGWDIIAGIGEGLWIGVKGLFGDDYNPADELVDGFQKELDINSPSRVMRDKVGKHMASGIGVGFTEEMNAVNIQMNRAINVDPNTASVRTASQTPIDIETAIIKAVSKAIANSKLQVDITQRFDGDLTALAKALVPKIKAQLRNEGGL